MPSQPAGQTRCRGLLLHNRWLAARTSVCARARAASIPVVGFNAVLTSEHFASFLVFGILHAALAISYIKARAPAPPAARRPSGTPRRQTGCCLHMRMPGMVSSCAGAPLRSLPGRRTLGLELSMRAALWRARHLGQAPGGREARPSNTLFGAWVCPMVSGRPAAQARAP